MANIFLDLASNAIATAGNTYGTAISATAGLTTVDMVSDVGNMVSCLLTSSAVAGSGVGAVKIQESSDDSTWADITGATFTSVSAANALQLISFKLTKRYVRAHFTLSSGTSVTLQVTFLGQRRTTPSGNGGWANETGGS